VVVALTGRDKARRLAIALVVLACVAGLAFAIRGTREVDANGDAIVESGDPCGVEISGSPDDVPACDPQDDELREAVEALIPAPDSEVLQQVQVGIDLDNRYTGVLVVNGIEVPSSQTQRRDGTNQLFFSPGDDQVLEEWAARRNCVRAVVWPIAEGREESRNVDWCFEVT
jgi:hypothetical protein